MKNFFYIILLSFLVNIISLKSISIVYNLRVAELTKRQALEEHFKHSFITAATLFEQKRKKYEGTHQLIEGGVATFIYAPHSFYMRTDFALAQVKSKKDVLCFSRIQTDDILFSAGYNYKINNQARITLSGVLGIPTHKDDGLQGIQFGTGHVGIGTQLDGVFLYIPTNSQHFVMIATRYIRFIKRQVNLKLPLQCLEFELWPGNLIDLYIAHHSTWGKGRHVVEAGYNPTFEFGAHIFPSFDEAVLQTNFMRSSFFANYRYRFLLHSLPSAVTLGLSYGFDHKPKNVGNKYIITLWASWGISF